MTLADAADCHRSDGAAAVAAAEVLWAEDC